MAEQDIIAQGVGSLTSALDIINPTTVFLFITFLVCIAVVLIFVKVMQHKHVLVIRKITGSKKIISKVKFREYRDKDGTLWYKTFKGKTFPPAPADCIDIYKNGKMWVEAYLNESEDLTYLQDADDKDKVKGLKHFTTNQRQLLINQLVKAQRRKGAGWKEHLATIFYVSSMTLIIIMGMIMYGEIAQPIIDANGQALQMTQLQNEQLHLLQDIKNNVQGIKSTGASSSGGAVEPPN